MIWTHKYQLWIYVLSCIAQIEIRYVPIPKFQNTIFTFLEPETATCKITGDICCKEESISTTTEFTPSDKCEDYSKFDFKCAKETECLDEGFK